MSLFSKRMRGMWSELPSSLHMAAETSKRLFVISVFLILPCFGQNWSNFLDSSRAIDWRSGVGFTIPSYTTACPTQPTLQAGSANAAANTTAINNALASCTSTKNVVNLPAGIYYVNSITYGTQGFQVLRGAGSGTGSGATYLYVLTTACNGGVCMMSSSPLYNGSPAVLPPSGTQQCLWTAGYAQGTTSITLSSCGGTPPLNKTIILDQANDSSDTSGVFLCDTTTGTSGSYVCTYKGYGAGNSDGRVISGVTHSEQQVTYVTGVTSLGGGSYTVTISPGVYFTNIRSGQSPGAWWPGFVQNDGIENLTLDYSQSTAGADSFGAIQFYNCYECWVKGIQSIDAGRNHVFVYQSGNDVVRDSYFYQSQAHATTSYTVEPEETSALLIENNIMQQVTVPVMFGNCSGCVTGYNYAVESIYTPQTDLLFGPFLGHNAGNNFDLWEGNLFTEYQADDAWGTSDQTTLFRNSIPGWASGKTANTVPILIRAWSRDYNIVGNILGQPSYHTVYQSYATSTTGGVNSGNESSTVYAFGYSGSGGTCSGGEPPCDALVWPTIMRWGNYDVVNAATQWNSTEASPAANTYVNANFTSSYFSTLSHTLPASLYYSSTPSWWPSGKAWPPIGPDVSTGNVGICTGTYAGAQATSSAQCTGGTLSTAWASTVTSIPAQDCYLNTMGGPPDGSGSVLSFNASVCYDPASSGLPAPPTGLTLTITVN